MANVVHFHFFFIIFDDEAFRNKLGIGLINARCFYDLVVIELFGLLIGMKVFGVGERVRIHRLYQVMGTFDCEPGTWYVSSIVT